MTFLNEKLPNHETRCALNEIRKIESVVASKTRWGNQTWPNVLVLYDPKMGVLSYYFEKQSEVGRVCPCGTMNGLFLWRENVDNIHVRNKHRGKLMANIFFFFTLLPNLTSHRCHAPTSRRARDGTSRSSSGTHISSIFPSNLKNKNKKICMVSYLKYYIPQIHNIFEWIICIEQYTFLECRVLQFYSYIYLKIYSLQVNVRMNMGTIWLNLLFWKFFVFLHFVY